MVHDSKLISHDKELDRVNQIIKEKIEGDKAQSKWSFEKALMIIIAILTFFQLLPYFLDKLIK